MAQKPLHCPPTISEAVLPCLGFKASLKSALVVLHRLWSEGHCSKGVRMAGHTHLSGIHLKDVTDAAVLLDGSTQIGVRT